MTCHVVSLPSRSPEDTLRIGYVLGSVLEKPPLLISLIGELGVGKTVFVKGFACALGLSMDSITSPTFVIANEYELTTSLRLIHADLYRIESRTELENAGFLDWIGPGAITLVEWGDRVADALPEDHLKVVFSRGEDENERGIRISATGSISCLLIEKSRSELTIQV